MNLNRSRVILVAVAAVAIAALAVSPAIGGPSMKKLIKKEVRKQVASKTGPQGPQGPRGLQGVQGTPGTPGTPGADGQNGATNVTVRVGEANKPATSTPLIKQCNTGERATGGGGGVYNNLANSFEASTNVLASYPVDSGGDPAHTETPTGWAVILTHDGGASNKLWRAFAVCAAP